MAVWACATGSFTRGSSIQNVAPRSGLFSTPIEPPITSMRRFDSASPKPVPSTPVCSAARRDARTGVAHLYAQPVAFDLLGGDGDRTGIGVVFDGVSDHVEENLLEP